MDTFDQDFKRAEKLHNEMLGNLTERQSLQKQGSSTGRVDYRLKGGLESLKQDLKNLSKVAYLYENDKDNKQYAKIS